MRSRARQAKKGVTLIEVMFAGAILALVAVSLFDGIGVASRIAHENAQFLVADAYAHDLAWKRSRESYSALSALLTARNGGTITETLSSNAVPALWRSDAPPVSYTRLSWPRSASGAEEKIAVVIDVDVEWGARTRRHRLSSMSHAVRAYHSGIGEENTQ